MEIGIQTKQAYSEIDEFLSLLDEKTRNEVPSKLRKFFKNEKDNNYHKGINPNIPIKEQNLKNETLALVALLNLQYWCKDENEKERLKQVYVNNENQYQEKLRKKYNPDNIFKKNSDNHKQIEDKIEEPKQLVEYKESTIKKFFEKVLRILHIRK